MTTTQPGGVPSAAEHAPEDNAPSIATPPPEHGSAAPATPPVDKRLKALRMFAISITVFNVLGHLFLGFEQSPLTPIVAVLVGYVLDLLLETLDARADGRAPGYTGGPQQFVDYLLPTHISSLACAMLLWGNESLWPYLLAVAVAVGSKYLFRVTVRGRRRHVLNPSNTGIAVTLILFPWVGIAPPYHFTNNTFGALDWLIPLGILMAGTMLNANLTGRWPLILGWVGGFAAQAVLRWLVLDHALLAALMPMTGVAFILFTNYMITDPSTTPTNRRNQVIFGVGTAAVYGLLVSFHIVFGLFFALVITCAVRGVILLATSRGAEQDSTGRATTAGTGGQSAPTSDTTG
ncbi:enediyne biosynthesis protein UnbU [Salinactinospora qingdaonensis]|uniref:Enediyne biosynthesis protein UnbU n=1 Tax=Salinactinospora qingdaonensis TaxID=702744 RepID=A0ABP7FY15_9ACTN